MKKMTENDHATAELAIKEENRRMRAFRFLTDLTRQRLYTEEMNLAEARGLIDELRFVAERFFPGKGDVFDLVTAPRLERVIEERFGMEAEREIFH